MRESVQVEKWDSKKDGPLSEKTMRQKLEKRGYSVSRYVYLPVTHFPDHTHPVDKIDAVLAGRFRMSMLGQEVILETGDLLYVPKGTLHSAEVVSDEPVVSLDSTKD